MNHPTILFFNGGQLTDDLFELIQGFTVTMMEVLLLMEVENLPLEFNTLEPSQRTQQLLSLPSVQLLESFLLL